MRDSSTVRVTVSGEIDGTNADDLAAYVVENAAPALPLVLDLRGVTFCGSAGVRALLEIGDRCERAGVALSIIPSRVLARLIALCDADDMLPVLRSA